MRRARGAVRREARAVGASLAAPKVTTGAHRVAGRASIRRGRVRPPGVGLKFEPYTAPTSEHISERGLWLDAAGRWRGTDADPVRLALLDRQLGIIANLL